MATADFPDVFAELKGFLSSHEQELVLVHDKEDNYYLDCPHDPFGKGKAHYFGSVTIRRNYVSFYLMPVYTHPELLDDISDNLNKRSQGKSCFNFKMKEEGLFDELRALVNKGVEKYKEVGYMS